jgi:spermidine/putrescine transport system substrate-binding protein
VGRLTRRQALNVLGSAGVAAAVGRTTAAGAGAAQAGAAHADPPMGPGGIPLARPDRPVALPLNAEPLESGLRPETGGTFKLFNYSDYISKELVDDFGRRYGVAMELSTFSSMDQAITRMATRLIQPDVTNISNERLAQAVAGKLIRPLNLDYIPNLKEHIWPSLRSPFYDVGSRYTVPYVVFATGIGWRDDKISEDIAWMDNPWSIFWKSARYKGYVGILDDDRQALGLAMLYRRFYDINTEDPAIIERALADLTALIPICNPKINETQARTLASGESWLHEADSGDLLGAFFTDLPAGYDGASLRFWSAPKGKAPVDNDCWAILSATEKPVLAHLWLNYLLEPRFAYRNFLWSGYQPPQVSITVDSLLEKRIIPENLRTTIFSDEAFGSGSMHYATLTSHGIALWQKAYARFMAGT